MILPQCTQQLLVSRQSTAHFLSLHAHSNWHTIVLVNSHVAVCVEVAAVISFSLSPWTTPGSRIRIHDSTLTGTRTGKSIALAMVSIQSATECNQFKLHRLHSSSMASSSLFVHSLSEKRFRRNKILIRRQRTSSPRT